MEDIIHTLHQGGFACVINNQDKTRTFTQRGVADLYHLLNNDAVFLKGAFVADKIVGKAAAALMILGGIKKLYTNIISSPALDLLRNTNIEFLYNKEVPFIVNRDQTDWCPMEKLCYQESSVTAILPLITKFITANRKKTE
jgi:iron complex outermembrane receptor protein